jgi:hypothetical protein
MLATLCTDAPDGEDRPEEIAKGLHGSIRLRDAATGKELRRLDSGNGRAAQLAFSPDGKLLAEVFWTADRQNSVVHLWDVAAGKRCEREPLGECALFSPDGSILITLEGSTDETINFWDTATGKKAHTISTKEGIRCLVLSPDGKVLATGSDKITLYPLSWDKASGVQVGTPRLIAYPPHWAITALAFSPDGRMLASSGNDYATHAIYLWETVSGKERARFQGQGIGVTSASLDVTSLSFTADGRRLASGSIDSTILIWDMTGRLQGERGASAPWLLRPAKLSDKELRSLWTDLASNNAARAGRAVWTLTAAGPSTVSFLKARLPPATARVPPEMVARFIADLDAGDFHIRERARRELEKLGESCEPALRQALVKQPSLEMRRRVQRLLSQLEEERKEPSGEVLRIVRAVEVLEHIGTREARQVLETLAAGAPGPYRTREAQAALERLQKASGGR